MRIGISGQALGDVMSMAEIVKIGRRYGVREYEIWPVNAPGEGASYAARDVKALAQLQRDENVQIYTVTMGAAFDADSCRSESGYAKLLCEAVDAAAALGARVVNHYLYWLNMSEVHDYAHLEACWKEPLEHARQAGVRLALENEAHDGSRTPELMRAILDHFDDPFFLTNFDATNYLHASAEGFPAGYEILRDKIGYHDHYDRQLGNGVVGQVLGHEVCGRVVKLGEGCTDVRLGDRVGMYTNHGAFQEYVLVDAHWGCTAMIPEGLSNEEASICEMFDGAYRSTISCANLQPHEKVLIVGAGPMGLTATAAAVAHYADAYVVDFHQNRLDKALELGAKMAFNHTGKNRHQMVEEILAAAGMMDMACICIALDESEEKDAFYMALETLRENGRMTGLNVEVKEEHHNHVMNPFHMNRKNILYRHNLTRPGTQRDFQHGYDMVAEGRVPLGRLITHHATLDQLPWALEMCHRHLDECIKFIIYPENRTGEKLVYELPENY